MDLALFDFDGTITVKGSWPGFMRAAVRRGRRVTGRIVLAPAIVGYYGGLVSTQTIREKIAAYGFRGDDPERIRLVGERYAEQVLPGLVRPTALERIAWHKARGDQVVIVSASLDVYLVPWGRTLGGVDVICTELETSDGVLTGRYLGADCSGPEKARRIRARYALERYDAIYAYGDSAEDREMLALAHRRYFRWQEVRDSES